jgi:uncharacterized membrane protein
MKFTWRTELPALVLVLLTCALSAWAWPGVPDRVPVHWNIDGQVDRWGSRAEGMLIGPVMALLVYALFRVLPRLDPGRANYERFAGAFLALRLAVLAFLAALQAVVISAARGARVDMNAIMPSLVGVLLVVLGNFMGKLRPNWFMGIRTPWTLSSKRSWSGTHQVGGWVLTAIGVLWIVSGRLPGRWPALVSFGSMIAGMLGLVVLSYVLWSRDPDKIDPAGTRPADEEPH